MTSLAMVQVLHLSCPTYALNLDRGASNVPKVWIASARVLDENNEGEEDRLFSLVLSEVVDFFVPLGVRVFNLSVNIKNRKWNAEAKRTVPRRSWIAPVSYT